jgi:hypothetical protein
VSASAQNVQPPVYGFGAERCSTYLSDIRARGEALSHSPEYPLVQNLTSKIGLDAQGSALVQICTEKPNQEFSRAVMELLDRIREAEGLKPLLR